jgi:hypothetical protein
VIIVDRVRTAALLCLAAGALGAASGLALALVEPSVDVDRFSYPLSAGSFAAVQVWFGVHHLGLLAGLFALRWAGVLPDTRPARWGWAAAAVGMAGLAVTEIIAIAAADSDVDSGIGAVLGGLYGVTCTAMGVGLTLAGVSVWRAKVWEGWRRGIVLALGVWVFVPMFPALVVTPTDGARLAIGAWMLLFAALGVALLSPVRRAVALPA